MKKILIVFIILAISSILMFNFFNLDKEKYANDKLHQKKFNTHFRTYTLTKPESLDFAGETVPLYAQDIWERYDKEIHKNVYWQSNTLFYLKRANKYFPIIEKILRKNNIPDDFKYLAVIESGLENVISPAGATGFWQFLESTGKEYGLEISNEVDERYHLEKSTQAACEYLKNSYEKFGSWTLSAAAYNMGINGIHNQLEKQSSKNYYNLFLNEETSRYIFRILAIKEIFENQKKYGFHIRPIDLYNYPENTIITISNENINLYDLAIEKNINYKILKKLNPWLRDEVLTNSNQEIYKLKIPTNSKIEIFEN